MRIAVFASGNGSNFQALADYLSKKGLEASIDWLFCDQPEAYVLKRATALSVPADCFSPKEFDSKKEYEEAILHKLKEKKIDLIVLAGYMRIIGPVLLENYDKRIINIHPSLLPAFPGLHGIRDAFEAGVKETGVTIHYIDQGVDTGPIIRQEKVRIEQEDTFDSLAEKIHRVEHRIYPEVISEIIENGGYLK
ncbi:TPA: phosphoribosylglycinamide formyltransferase [Enterococcus faecium]|uniref:phosphoribosylglycinamide formyltransferase n=1 Tax=Enterococcus sp. E5-37 TaxID=2996024 RepID=UPI0019E17F70|nr:phosphoribosylglycinamide formyltransferase [Enterococcus sp. E5-37]EGP4943922.1 phosphoribosylglycinamide formyltransferase [Enterococcus faecium]EGP4998648.1 phosphoribosylglycinamide formyltransferase [Enterococcus faecium]EME7161399.1 phosphoribosylglycinamide formyltransferase [Enterococcus faecium]EME7226517.1 phosphoribosylglycinamide formyltransferase [Enterococcus faecium]EME8211737.1 phosphoribosylglycinamide formyltransferase [Enterococcus faecium]